jgi:hypothetical protein
MWPDGAGLAVRAEGLQLFDTSMENSPQGVRAHAFMYNGSLGKI